MKKTALIMLMTCITFLTNCKPSAPNKLPGIPEKAFWAGEDTIGHWFIIESIDKIEKTVHFKIYNDKTGMLVSDKTFKLYCYLCEDKIDLDKLEDEIRYYNEVKYNNENYIMLKTKDSHDKNAHLK
jgi:hypothetical protein